MFERGWTQDVKAKPESRDVSLPYYSVASFLCQIVILVYMILKVRVGQCRHFQLSTSLCLSANGPVADISIGTVQLAIAKHLETY